MTSPSLLVAISLVSYGVVNSRDPKPALKPRVRHPFSKCQWLLLRSVRCADSYPDMRCTVYVGGCQYMDIYAVALTCSGRSNSKPSS